MGICLDCKNFTPDDYPMLKPSERGGECRKIWDGLEVVRVECGSYCYGGTAIIESVRADFGCIFWEEKGDE